MSLYPTGECVNSNYCIAVLNSNLIFDFYREFINCTVNVQINDLRQIPFIVPSTKTLQEITELVNSALNCKLTTSNKIECNPTQSLTTMEKKIDNMVYSLYMV